MRKVAFLVGNDTFPKDSSIPPLRFTQNDARDLAKVLEDPETCGFETKVYLNEASQNVLGRVDGLCAAWRAMKQIFCRTTDWSAKSSFAF